MPVAAERANQPAEASAIRRKAFSMRVSPHLDEAARMATAEVFEHLATSAAGLTEEEAAARLIQYGPNEVGREKQHGWAQRLWTATRNPLVILLTVLAVISFATGDVATGIIILVMMLLGLSLRLL